VQIASMVEECTVKADEILRLMETAGPSSKMESEKICELKVLW
jgi:hypothetical protein